MSRTAIIGAGWAGCAAALTLARAGHRVTVFEAAKIAGGRARRVGKDARSFDNGQHLLLGAYTRSLAMIRSLHGERFSDVIDQRPLALVAAPGNAECVAVQAKNLPAPFHLLHAMMTARGLSIADKLSINLWCAKTLYGKLNEAEMATQTVAQLIAEQPRRAKAWLWEPLCVAALNTPAERASARVFIEVLRRAFLGDARASDLAIPRVDLSALLPDPALAEVTRLGGDVRLSDTVNSISVHGEQIKLSLREREESFDQVIVATGPQHIERLFSGNNDISSALLDLFSFSYEPISTLHYEFSAGIDPESFPMLMLDGSPGQWLFTHRLANGQVRASVVISAHYRDPTGNETANDLLRDGLAQLRKSFAVPNPIWQQLITEKRATYSCTPDQTARLHALPKSIGRIYFAGDWCVPELPATLESAVIAGENAANQVLKDIRG
jgi:hydroxysqualene dehydroxylase